MINEWVAEISNLKILQSLLRLTIKLDIGGDNVMFRVNSNV